MLWMVCSRYVSPRQGWLPGCCYDPSFIEAVRGRPFRFVDHRTLPTLIRLPAQATDSHQVLKKPEET